MKFALADGQRQEAQPNLSATTYTLVVQSRRSCWAISHGPGDRDQGCAIRVDGAHERLEQSAMGTKTKVQKLVSNDVVLKANVLLREIACQRYRAHTGA